MLWWYLFGGCFGLALFPCSRFFGGGSDEGREEEEEEGRTKWAGRVERGERGNEEGERTTRSGRKTSRIGCTR